MKNSILLCTVILIYNSTIAQQGIGILGVKKNNQPSPQISKLQNEIQLLQQKQQTDFNLSKVHNKRYVDQIHHNLLAAPTSPADNAKADSIKNIADSINQEITNTSSQILAKTQQINDINNDNLKKSSDEISLKDSLTTWGLYGIGNLNTETFQNVNASGKLAGYFRPYKGKKAYTTVYFSFNKNASNSDSLLAGNFLFPDAGSNSFALTAEHSILLNQKDFSYPLHFVRFITEFSLKNINGRNADSSRNFTVLNFVAAANYTYYTKINTDNFYFSIGPEVALNSVPDKYSTDYKYLFHTDTLSNRVVSAGVKVTFQINSLTVFADLRNVFGSQNKIAVNALRGFNYNIGFIFNADLIER